MNTGDLEPAWAVSVSDLDGAADFADVSGWRFVAYRKTSNGNVVVFTDTAPTVVSATGPDAVLRHVWNDGETDVAGVLHAEVVAVWPDGREQTFAGATITIKPSID